MMVDDKTKLPDVYSPPYEAGDGEQCLKAGQHAPTDIHDKNLCLTCQPADSSP